MDNREIKAMLSGYRTNIATVRFINAKLGELQTEVDRLTAAYREDVASVSASATSPTGGSHTVSSPTERAAMKLIESPVPIEAEALIRRMDALRAEAEDRARRTEYVEAMLAALNERELFVVQRHIIDGMPWCWIKEEHNRKFLYHVETPMLRTLQDNAIKKMQKIIR